MGRATEGTGCALWVGWVLGAGGLDVGDAGENEQAPCSTGGRLELVTGVAACSGLGLEVDDKEVVGVSVDPKVTGDFSKEARGVSLFRLSGPSLRQGEMGVMGVCGESVWAIEISWI